MPESLTTPQEKKNDVQFAYMKSQRGLLTCQNVFRRQRGNSSRYLKLPASGFC